MTRARMSLPLVLTVTVVAGLWPAAGEAQSRRPVRAIFGGGSGQTEQSLTVTASLVTGIDDAIFVDDVVTIVPIGLDTDELVEADNLVDSDNLVDTENANPTDAAQYVQVSGGLAYMLSRESVDLRATFDSAARSYTSLPDNLLMSHAATFTATWQLARSTSASASQSISWQPLVVLAGFPVLSSGSSYQPALGPGFQLPTGLDAGVRRDEYISYQGGAGFSHRLTRRGTFSLDYAYQRQALSDEGAFQSQTGGAHYSYALSQNLSLRAGYAHTWTEFPGRENVAQGHSILAGVDYNRALGLSRRTSLAFGTGASGINYGDDTTYFVTGNARLHREIGRTWGAWLAYDRSVQFVAAFAAPSYADTGSIGVAGDFSRRIQFNSSISVALANLGSTNGTGYETYSGYAGLTFGLNRYLALAVGYSIFSYEFGADATLPTDLPRQISRHGVSASLSTWFPLFERARRTDASR